MKKLIFITLATMAVSVGVWMVSHDGRTVPNSDTAELVAAVDDSKSISPDPMAPVAVASGPEPGAQATALVPMVGEREIRDLNLAPLQAQRVEEIARATRSKVMRRLATAAQVDAPAPNVRLIAVSVPESEAVRQSERFRAEIAQLLGKSPHTLSPSEVAALRRLEFQMLDFGRFPVAIEFAGNGPTIAASARFDFEMVRDYYPNGSAEPLRGVFRGSWDLASLKDIYGALAERMLTDRT